MCRREPLSLFHLFRTMTASICIVSLLSVAACTKDMAIEDRLKAQNHEAPPPIAGTVPHDRLTDSGEVLPSRNAEVVSAPPEVVTLEFLKRGQRSYEIHCLPCHDRAGTGNGIIVERGFKKPSPLDAPATRRKPDAELFRDISEGKGTMAGYRGIVSPEDRWALVAFVRALQLSRHLPASLLEREDLESLTKEKGP